MVLSPVEGRVKSIPNIFNFNTQTVVILDSFNSRKLAFVDPIHKKPWTSFFLWFSVFWGQKIFFSFAWLCFWIFSNLQCLENLYYSRSLLQLLSHQLLDLLIMLTVFTFCNHNFSIVWVMDYMEYLSDTTSEIVDVLISWIWLMSTLINCFSLLLSLTSVCFWMLISFSKIGIQTVRGAWLETSLQSR